jgi:hypothetical protein
MQRLSEMFETERCYPYKDFYKRMGEVEIESRRLLGNAWNGQLRMYIGPAGPGDHPGTHNQVSYNSGELAAVYKTDGSGRPLGYNLAIQHKQTGRIYPMSYLSPHCDPMTSPFLFPRGEQGFKLIIF